MNNSNLHNAKKAKNDEFYTKYSDIKDEMQYYKNHLKGKIIYCNCDDYRWSNFVKYFKDNFRILGLSGLYATNYDNGDGAYKYYYDGISEVIKKLNGNGSYDSAECLEILKTADLVISNPPFSLWRHYFKTLIDNNKKFIIIGNQNAVTNKDVFPYIKSNEVIFGITRIKSFTHQNGDDCKFGNISWYNNLGVFKYTTLNLTATYDPKIHQVYDNYCAINCDKTKDLPKDDYIIIDIPDDQYDKWKEAYGDDLEIYEG